VNDLKPELVKIVRAMFAPAFDAAPLSVADEMNCYAVAADIYEHLLSSVELAVGDGVTHNCWLFDGSKIKKLFLFLQINPELFFGIGQKKDPTPSAGSSLLLGRLCKIPRVE